MSNVKIAVLGFSGMLGQALMKVAKLRGLKALGLSRTSVDFHIDITDSTKLQEMIDRINPDVIINSAAIVDIEKCEKDPCTAYLINAQAPAVLTAIARKKKIYLIHISTDHYFTGDGNKRHTEEDKVSLLNEYARSKYAGETFVLLDPSTLVIRTNIVGFRHSVKMTFVEWIIDSLKKGKEITLFDDYFTSSMHVRQLAVAIFDLIKRRSNGIINIGSREVFSKKDFIVMLAHKLDLSLSSTKTGQVSDSDMVIRAESDGLNVTKAEKLLGYSLPTLKEVVESISNEYKESNYAV